MKILMLGWELPPHNSGGLGVACYHMSKALASAGADIDFVLPYKAHHPETEFMTIHAATSLPPLGNYVSMGAYDSASVTEIESEGGLSLDKPSIRELQREYVRFIERHVVDNKPEVIHAHDWLTMEAGIRAKEISGAPLIVHVHATEFDRAGSSSGNPIVHEIEYQGLMMADRIIAVSNITKSIIAQRYNIPADRIEVVHNAIDASYLEDYDYDRSTYRYLESLKEDGYKVVVTVARFTVQKGLAHFIKAASLASSKYPKLVFLLAGDGEQRNELIDLVAEHGIADKVFFTGFVRGKQWRDAYAVADIFVLSSVSEPFGLTALEAAHHDAALVISKQSGVGEVLHSILRYDFWDINRLADQLVGIAASDALLGELQQGAKREYTRLSWQDVAKQCQQIYQKMRHNHQAVAL